MLVKMLANMLARFAVGFIHRTIRYLSSYSVLLIIQTMCSAMYLYVTVFHHCNLVSIVLFYANEENIVILNPVKI